MLYKNFSKQAFLFFFLLLVGVPPSYAYERFGIDQRLSNIELEKYDRENNIQIPMRDGIGLSSDIIFPAGERQNLPVVLVRTPYDLDGTISAASALYTHWLRNGYALVFQNERGTHWSEGSFDEFLFGAKKDGYDTVEWISNQSWSNGKVGTFGCSSSAENQLGLATQSHPAHKAMIPMAPGAGIGQVGSFHEQGNFYRGGVWQPLWLFWFHQYGHLKRPKIVGDFSIEERSRLRESYNLQPNKSKVDYYSALQSLPLRNLMHSIGGPATPLDDYLGLSPGDSKWRELDLVGEGDSLNVPALWMFSWYDIAIAPNIELVNYARRNRLNKNESDNNFMLVSPVTHCGFGSESEQTIVGKRDVGDARYDYIGLFTDWFDYWLKGTKNAVLEKPKVQVFTMGDNDWRSYKKWPVDNTDYVRYYLNSTGSANSSAGDGTLQRTKPIEITSDTFMYDPGHPVRSPHYTAPLGDAGAYDQAELELRHDVLVYSTPVLEEDVNVTGPIEVQLYVSSDVNDTDFTVKLVDVHPDGKAYNLDDSIQRARYREGYDKSVLMEKGQVYKITVGPLVTSNVFKKGHQIRVEISSSYFPKYARNLNTGGDNVSETKWVVAHNSIYHSPDYPSYITLPIVSNK